MDQPIRFANMPKPEESWGYSRSTIDYIQHAAAHGLYEIRGMGAKRKLPHFDDLLFLAASLSRYPLEGYRERCETKTILGSRFATKPIELAKDADIRGAWAALQRASAVAARIAQSTGTRLVVVESSAVGGEQVADATQLPQAQNKKNNIPG